MTNRTVKVLGWGAGSSPATITAKVDDELVFSGDVDLVEMTAENASEQTAPTLFTFEIPMDFSGTKRMNISVDKAGVRFGQIVANYSQVGGFFTGVEGFSDVAEFDSNHVREPRRNIFVDGIPQTVNRGQANGTWHWVINSGSTFEHDVTIDLPGVED